jgi:Tol biopolymer transport system component
VGIRDGLEAGNRPRDRARFALALYALADRKWKTYGDLDDIGDVAFSPDGSRVAFYARQNGNPVIMIFNTATETFSPHPYKRGLRSHPNPSWSPDGTRLALEIRDPEDPVVAVLDIKTDEMKVIGKGGSPRWSPNGEWIAYYADTERCMLVRPDGTGHREVAKAEKDREFISGSPVWSPDGTQLLLNENKDERELLDVVLIDLASGRKTTKSRSGWPVFGWAAYSANKPEKK